MSSGPAFDALFNATAVFDAMMISDSIPTSSHLLDQAFTPSTPRPLIVELKTTRLIVQRILTPIVVVCGIAGNLVNIAVLTRRWMKSSTNRYLTALAVCDVLYLVLVFTISLNHYEALDVGASHFFQRYQFLVGRPLTDTFSNAGVWLTLTFTVERYIGVCHPMRGKVWCTPQRAKHIIFVVCAAAAIVTFPEFFECQMVEKFDSTTNQTRLRCASTWFGSTDFYSIGYKYANQTLFTFLPLILLLVFNSLLVRQVMVAASERRKMMGKPRQSDASTGRSAMSSSISSQQDRQSRDQQRITVMLIAVVVVFLMCQLPQAIQHIYIVWHKIIGQAMTDYQLQVLRITGNVFNLLVMVNCSANFILYSAFSTKFRATFSRLFCRSPCCVTSLNGLHSSTSRDLTTESTSTTGVRMSYKATQSNAVGSRRSTSGFAIGRTTDGTMTSSRRGESGDNLVKC